MNVPDDVCIHEIDFTDESARRAVRRRCVLALEPGEHVHVRLYENVSTGYLWTVTSQDDAFVLLNSEDEWEEEDPEIGSLELVGSARIRTLRFSVDDFTTPATLVLTHKRPWERESVLSELTVVICRARLAATNYEQRNIGVSG
jgi:predicted secreted protein